MTLTTLPEHVRKAIDNTDLSEIDDITAYDRAVALAARQRERERVEIVLNDYEKFEAAGELMNVDAWLDLRRRISGVPNEKG